MKNILKILAVIITLLIGTIIITPYFFKDKIAALAKEEINKNVNALVDFKDVSLSLFSNFPDFTFGISGLEVVGIDQFDKETLFKSENISLTLDLASVFAGDYTVKEIHMENSEITLKVLKNGKANWDIAIEETSKPTNEEPSFNEKDDSGEEFNFAISLFKITNANITYNDIEGNMSSIIDNFDMELSGDFTADNANINLKSSIKKISYKMDNIAYLNKVKMTFDAEILSDISEFKFTFKENNMTINNVAINFDGYVSMPSDDIYTDIKFSAPDTDFKSFLSLIPAFYTEGYEDIKADGKFELSGWAKGIYNDNSMPAFDLDIKVNNAKFQYPDLPKYVNDINIITNISSPSSDLNDMVIDLKKFHFSIAGNPMDISMILRTPMEDPNIDAHFKGKMDLSTIKDVYPMESDMKISGLFTSNIQLKGKQSDIDKGRYSKFIAKGKMNLRKLNYKDNDFPEGIIVHNASMEFTPRFINISNFKTTYNKNTLNLKGRVSNYMSYALSDGTLKGKFELTANYLNMNAFMAESSTTNETSSTTSSEEKVDEQISQALDIPSNIDMQLKCIIGRIRYDKINMKAIYGNMSIKKKKVSLDNLKMEMLGGKMNMNGYYNSTEIDTPRVSLVMGIHDFNIKKTYKAMEMVKKLAPIMENVSGRFSTIFVYKGILDKNMEPNLATVNASGLLSTTKLTIKGAKSIERLADELKVNELRTLTTTPMAIPFKIVNGDLIISEFKTNINDMPLTMSGTTKLNQDIDYKLRIDVPRENLGKDANDAIAQIEESAKALGLDVKASKTIVVNAKITGTATDPKVGLDFEKGKQGVKDEVTDAAKDKAKEESKKEADKQLDNASKEADKAIENSDLTDEEKEKARAAKKKLEEEAKKLLDLW